MLIQRHSGDIPSAKILPAFCSEIPLICSSTRRGVYATDSTVLKPPSTISCISRLVRPETPYKSREHVNRTGYLQEQPTSRADSGVGAPGPVIDSSIMVSSSAIMTVNNGLLRDKERQWLTRKDGTLRKRLGLFQVGREFRILRAEVWVAERCPGAVCRRVLLREGQRDF